ncbi:DUF4064 domain-containing protein [Staphylococcus simiae]|uniref:DUF4064 domain-containing protein n=1 Tax=Staphylococcus simiae TaxID=308354 RepID=UPI001A9566A4|nr:DUF4064 domain-containing protein [Staphylococcus simiae]MBO1199865.1 DUF4064 domain-containing protein [Staphylococcus simiae]MBO1202126.1 DUF4064 domain-containing protein [Staphylococcus simiae]MBO1204390.1 DUF4064 domain-containing protein [Staphylococcus simiae]MBO1211930.1 DUF4064 domain-containing protein [Staphylococcus simiae]MBO1230569.1 DUF4064 domain-containing protein [Staphylococcus simiae]
MLNRTKERVMVWIGIVIQLLSIITTILTMPKILSGEQKNEILEQVKQQQPNVTDIFSMEQLSQIITITVIVALVLSIVSCILAIISISVINKKVRMSGSLLIIAGVITFLTSFIAGILYIVAGIMLVVKKTKQQFRNINNNSWHSDSDNKTDSYSSSESTYMNQDNDQGSHENHDDFIEMERQRLKEKKEQDPYKY